MPELPEVETIRLGLSKKLIGSTVTNIKILNLSSFQGKPKQIIGTQVTNIWRRGKILGIDLIVSRGDASEVVSKKYVYFLGPTSVAAEPRETHLTILFHLKMSGQLILLPITSDQQPATRFIGGHPTQDMLGQLPNKSTRVIFEFQNQRLLTPATRLYFNDQRKFGWIKVLEDGKSKLEAGQIIKKLGPEPLESGFTWQSLKANLLKHKSLPIKTALLDQTIVAGIGNIYASEACFNAKIHPIKKVQDLTDQNFKALFNGVVKALQDGLKYGGSTKTHFVNAEGKKGYFLDHAKVYWQDGEACQICQTRLKKIKLNGRGTYLCPSCQAL